MATFELPVTNEIWKYVETRSLTFGIDNLVSTALRSLSISIISSVIRVSETIILEIRIGDDPLVYYLIDKNDETRYYPTRRRNRLQFLQFLRYYNV